MSPGPEREIKRDFDTAAEQPTKTLPLGQDFEEAEFFESPLASLLEQRYALERELGRGGSGIVYLGRDEKLHNKPVVVKFLIGEKRRNEWFRKKFRDEIAALSRLNHPGIVGILDAGQTPAGTPFLVMQYVDGVTLRSLITPGGFELSRAGHVVQQIGQALAAAHERGVYHRDLKPENIMVRQSSNGDFVWLIDFGIATIREEGFEHGSQLTRVAGSPAYMAPEQFRGQPSGASDIFAMGVITWELLAGKLPFHNLYPIHAIEKPNFLAELDELRCLRPDVPEAVILAIRKALAIAPEDRFQTATEFTHELAAAFRTPFARKCAETSTVQQRALDVAMARQIPLYKPAEVLALIRRTESGGLAALLKVEKDLSVTEEEIRSKPFDLEFPMGPAGLLPLELGLRIECPDFVPKTACKIMLVPPTGDSDTCTFLITPMHLGELQVNLEVTRGDVMIASRALRTEATPSDRKPIDSSNILISIPLSVMVRASDGVPIPAELTPVSQTGAQQVNPVPKSPKNATLEQRPNNARATAKRSRRRAVGTSVAFGVAVLMFAFLTYRLLHTNLRAPIAEVKKAPEPQAPLPPPKPTVSEKSGQVPASKKGTLAVGQLPINARELFYAARPELPGPGVDSSNQPATKQGNPATSALGLRYSILKVSKNDDSKTDSAGYMEVDPDSTFAAGDRIRLRVEANANGFLYVVSQGSTGAWSLLFPANDVDGGSNRVQERQSQFLPPKGQWAFDQHAGTERLFLVLSRQPLPDLNGLIYANGLVTSSSISDDAIREVRYKISSGAQIFAKSNVGINGTLEHAGYAVNPRGGPHATVVVDLAITHR